MTTLAEVAREEGLEKLLALKERIHRANAFAAGAALCLATSRCRASNSSMSRALVLFWCF